MLSYFPIIIQNRTGGLCVGFNSTKRVAQVMLAMLLILSSIHLISIEKPILETVSAESTWFETDWSSP